MYWKPTNLLTSFMVMQVQESELKRQLLQSPRSFKNLPESAYVMGGSFSGCFSHKSMSSWHSSSAEWAPNMQSTMITTLIIFIQLIDFLLNSSNKLNALQLILQEFIMMSEEVRKLILNYEEEHHQKVIEHLLSIKPPSSQLDSFNEGLDSDLKDALIKLMEDGSCSDVCSLLSAMFNCLRNESIKKSVIINLLDNILECAGVSDLKEIVKVVREHISSFKNLSSADLNKMLRIINHLLKRVSKTEDYQIRGQLHVALTKILTVCHDSGFHYRFQPIKATPILKNDDELIDDEEFRKNETINSSFFEDFWQLQNYFQDPNCLGLGKEVEGEKEADPEITTMNLKKIQETLNETFTYFDKYPANQHSDSITYPIKFMKLYNLFPLQLNNSYFRKIILLQCLIFCFGLKNCSSKSAIELNQQQKTIIEFIQSNTIKKLQRYSKKDEINIYENFVDFQQNQLNWIELKDNWKEKKKNFFKDSDYNVRELKRQKQNPNSQPIPEAPKQPELHVPIDLKESKKKALKEVSEKLKINPNNMQKFLKNNENPKIEKEPTVTSFSYYYEQAQNCLETFDHENNEQTEFETRSEYNLFQWKAIRSLFRQKIGDVFCGNKSGDVLKDYRMLSILHKKQSQLGDPKKKVKLDPEEKDKTMS